MTTETPDPALEKALLEYNSLINAFQSIQMATSNTSGVPEVSYSPAVMDEQKHFYVYVSEMAAHTANLLNQKKASVMVIADESASAQIFARKRATFTCQASEVERESAHWVKVMALFSAKFGNVVDHLKGMADFHLMELTPEKGRLVIGFGKAYDVTGENLGQLEHIKGENGQGHRPVQQSHGNAASKPMTPADVERIVSHMNEDHADSVLHYVHYYGKRPEVPSATLLSLDAEALHISLGSGEEVLIPVIRPLLSAHDAHMVLVDMAKEARKNLTEAKA